MAERHPVGNSPNPVTSWIQQNVVDAAPMWIQLLRSAVANVRTR